MKKFSTFLISNIHKLKTLFKKFWQENTHIKGCSLKLFLSSKNHTTITLLQHLRFWNFINCERNILDLLARTCHSYFYITNSSSIKKLSFFSPWSILKFRLPKCQCERDWLSLRWWSCTFTLAHHFQPFD